MTDPSPPQAGQSQQPARPLAARLQPALTPDPLERRQLWRSRGIDLYATRWERTIHPDQREGATSVPAIVLMRRGCYTLRSQGRTVVGDVNSATFYNTGEDFAVSHPSSRSTTGLALRIAPAAIEGALADLSPAPPHRPSPDAPFRDPHAPLSPQAFLLQHLLAAELAHTDPDAVLIDEAVIRLIRETMWPAVGPATLSPRPRADRDNLARVAAAKEFMNSAYKDNLSLDIISDAAECSPFHLCRQFSRLTHLPVHRYLNRVRLRHALSMLDASDLTAIALDCGFSGHSHFTSAFRQEFGATPSSLRAPGAGRRLRAMLAEPPQAG